MTDTSTEQATIEGMPTGPGKPVLRSIPIDELPNGPQLPNGALRRSVRERGVVIPPVVFQKVEGEYHVAAGSRTIMAARDAEIDSVECLVYAPEDWPYFASYRLTLNSNRTPSPIAELDSIQAMMVSGANEETIAAHHGMPVATVRKRLMLASLKEPLTIALQTNKISLGIAERCARLTAEQQDMAIERLNENGKLTAKDINEIVDATTPDTERQAPLPVQKDWKEEVRKASLVALEQGITAESVVSIIYSVFNGDDEDE